MPILPRSLNARLILLVSCILLATGAMSGWLIARQQSAMLDASMRRNAEMMTRNLGDRCAYYLVLQDFAGLESLLMRSVGHADMLRLQVCEPDGVLVSDVASGPDGPPQRKADAVRIDPPRPRNATMLVENGGLIVWQPIDAGNQIGWIKAVYSMAAIREMERETWRNSILLSLFWVAGSTALLLLMLRPAVQDIGRLAAFARSLDAHKGVQMTIRQGTAELEELGASLNYASNRLLSSEQELIREKEVLRVTAEEVRDLYNSAPCGYHSLDRDGVISQINDTELQWLGYSREEIIGKKKLLDVATGKGRETFAKHFPLFKKQGWIKDLEIEMMRKDGTVLPVLVSATAIYDEAGEYVMSRTTVYDISERKQEEQMLHRLNRELQAVSNCNEVLMRATDEEALLRDVCQIIHDTAGYRMVWVGYAEHDEAKTVRPVAWAGVEDGYLADAHITWADTVRGRGPTGIAIRNNESVCIQDFATDPAAVPWRENALQRGYRSSIALPLRDERQNAFGALMIYSPEPKAFTPNEIRLLEELAGDLAFGIVVLRNRIERKRVEESLREQEYYTQSLLRLSRRLEHAQTYEEALNAARDEVRSIIGYQNLWVYLFTEDKKHARALIAGGPIAETVMSEGGTATLTIQGDRMLEEIAEAKDIVVVEDARIDERTDKKIVAMLGNRTIVNVPIFLMDKPLGSVGTGSFGDEGVRIPTSSEKDYFTALASHLAITLDRIHLLTRRKETEEELRMVNQELDQRVKDRTADLEKKSMEIQENQIELMNIVEDLNEKTAELERANAKLYELDRLKSMFIASMSHELRTPLNSIIGFSSIMLNEWAGPVTAEQKENLAAVLRSGKHLLSLINDVIDVSKIEAGKIESIAEEFDVRDVVMEAVETLRKEIKNKGLELKVVAPQQLMHADRRRVLQCLLNLISNAVKYTSQGSITVSAELSTDGSLMTMAVEDTGIGIQENELGKLFLPFVRLAPPAGAIVPGTGLGLYLTNKLVREILGGDILVRSTYGTGSRFTLRVPVTM